MPANITAARVSSGGVEAIRSTRPFEFVRLTGHAATAASGSAVLTDLPVDGDTLTLNGFEITFLDTVVDPTTDVEIGADVEETLATLLAFANGSVNALLTVATYTSDEVDTLTITYDTTGTGGNAYTLATDSEAVTLSGATLLGGTATTIVGDTSGSYVSGVDAPSFCVGSATLSSISGQTVVFKSLVALGTDEVVVRLYGR